ncbi:unnamed protein product [Parajaminaea phylloscopi]
MGDRGTLQVAYLGPPGTYSHQVALQAFPEHAQQGLVFVPQDTITQAAQWALQADTETERNTQPLSRPANTQGGDDASHNTLAPLKRMAVLPLENSTHGPVTETLAVLDSFDGRYAVTRKTRLAVRHALLVGPRTYAQLVQIDDDGSGSVSEKALQSIQRVVSHEQAIGQCKHFLDAHLPLTRAEGHRVHATSTAWAASHVADGDGDDEKALTAAIASEICADHDIYDVRLVRRSIQDRDDNWRSATSLTSSHEFSAPAHEQFAIAQTDTVPGVHKRAWRRA